MDNNIESELNLIESNEERIMANVQSDMLGIGPSIRGMKLRPIKLSGIALLQRTGNEVISGKPADQCHNLIIDACKLVVLQSVSLREAIKLADNPEELTLRAYELAETISPSEVEEFQDAVIGLVSESQETRVEPIPTETAREELTVDSLGE
jgi:hypothetical protein